MSYADLPAPFSKVEIPPAPAERVFVIQNDNCGQYLTPADQQHPLIYEDELEYTTEANGEHQASWVQKDVLKLPVHCQYCAEKAETDAQGVETQPNDYVIYFGIDFLKGSSVCVSVSNDGTKAKSLHPTITALLDSAPQGPVEQATDAGGRSDADLKRGASSFGQALQAELFALERGSAEGAEDEVGSMSLMRPQSIIISTLNMGQNLYNSALVAPFTNAQVAMRRWSQPPGYTAKQSNTTFTFEKVAAEAAGLRAPWTMPIHISLALKAHSNNRAAEKLSARVSENCETLSAQELPKLLQTGQLTFHDQRKAGHAMDTIATKGYGCWTCASMSEQSKRKSYSYITSPGFEGIPSHEDFKKGDVELQTHCSRKEEQLMMNTNQIVGINFFHTYIRAEGQSSYRELPCYTRIKNCAICGGLNPDECKLCFDGFALNEVKSMKAMRQHQHKAAEPACIFEFCPIGHQRIVNWNGFTYCEPCKIQNCNQCATVNALTEASKNKTEDVEICLQCEGGFILSDNKDKCSDTISYLKEAEPTAEEAQSFDFILETRSTPINPQELTKSDMDQIIDNEKSNKFEFIQQALYKINQLAANHTEVNATIWLLKGDHFFFYCDELVSGRHQLHRLVNGLLMASNKTPNKERLPPLKHNELCTLKSMQNSYPTTDNVNLVIRSLGCDSYDAKQLKRSKVDTLWF